MVKVGTTSVKGMISSIKLIIPAILPFIPEYILVMIKPESGAQKTSIKGINPTKSNKILNNNF